MASDNEPGELAIRANTLLADAARARRAASGAHARDPGDPRGAGAGGAFRHPRLSPVAEGAFLAQSRAAMLVARALAPQPGERVLDLCAAPGGKSDPPGGAHGGRAARSSPSSETRAGPATLARTAQRLGASNVRVELGDAARWPSWSSLRDGPAFDRVLVDPPCSGLGTLQARADLRWRVTPDSIEQMAAAQREILAAGAGALRPGGVLVYSTCTISPTENERVIDAFLDSRRDFAADDLAAELPAFRIAPPDGGAKRAPVPAAAVVLTLPHRDRTAGFFIARLRRS